MSRYILSSKASFLKAQQHTISTAMVSRTGRMRQDLTRVRMYSRVGKSTHIKRGYHKSEPDYRKGV